MPPQPGKTARTLNKEELLNEISTVIDNATFDGTDNFLFLMSNTEKSTGMVHGKALSVIRDIITFADNEGVLELLNSYLQQYREMSKFSKSVDDLLKPSN